MANAIKKISIERGHDVTGYTLCCFGGAAGQHACLVADALAMPRVFIHPYAGVLSAYGMGLADISALREQAIEARLDAGPDAATRGGARAARRSRARGSGRPGRAAGQHQSRAARPPALRRHRHRRHREFRLAAEDARSNSSRATAAASASSCPAARWWSRRCRSRRPAVASRCGAVRRRCRRAGAGAEPERSVRMFSGGVAHDAPVYRRDALRPGDCDRRARHHRGSQRHDRDRAAVAGASDPAQSPGADAQRAAAEARGDRHARGARHAGNLQQSLHGDRRADGRDARQHRALGQHQGAARFLLRAVRHRGRPHRQRAAPAGAPGRDGRERPRRRHGERREDAARAMPTC